MIGIYFSGTGNTKHCVEKLVKLLDVSAQSFPLEHMKMVYRTLSVNEAEQFWSLMNQLDYYMARVI